MMKIYDPKSEGCNRVKIGGETVLHGDPKTKIEKETTIIRFPGGHIEIARTLDNKYWIHVGLQEHEAMDEKKAKFVDVRLNFEGRYDDAAKAVLQKSVEAGDLNHIAFLMEIDNGTD